MQILFTHFVHIGILSSKYFPFMEIAHRNSVRAKKEFMYIYQQQEQRHPKLLKMNENVRDLRFYVKYTRRMFHP